MPPLINVRSISKAFGADPAVSERLLYCFRGRSHRAHWARTDRENPRCCESSRGPKIRTDGEICRSASGFASAMWSRSPSSGPGIRSIRGRGALKDSAVPEAERGTRFAETLGRAGFVDLERKPRLFPEAGRSGWRSWRRWCRGPTFCCWMSLRIIWTWRDRVAGRSAGAGRSLLVS